jgi:hypothetical protein
LRNVDDELKEKDPDFEIYTQIAKYIYPPPSPSPNTIK